MPVGIPSTNPHHEMPMADWKQDTMQTVEQLASQISCSGVEFQSGPGGLAKILVSNAACEAEAFLHGAHVTRFVPRGQRPVLWMSQSSWFEHGKPIRGGIPICFPWFGPHPDDDTAPAHGFARTAIWDLVDAVAVAETTTELLFRLESAGYVLQYVVRFSDELSAELTVQLSEGVATPQRFEQALHSYFSVSDVRQARVEGLERSSYVDKVSSAKRMPATGTAIEVAAECDRVYLNTSETCRILDPGMNRIIRVEKRHSQNTVVWNPWVAKSQRMPDFGDEEWPGMLCVETANVGDAAVVVAPGGSHTMALTIALETAD